jgi:hypothetical protein
MATNRVAAATVLAAAVSSSAVSLVAKLAPGAVNPTSTPVLVRADCALIGASSVTAVTVGIYRGQAAGGTALYSQTFTVAGAVTVPASVAFRDTAYDGTGYSVGMEATGAAATADCTLEAQPLTGSF